MPLSQNTITLHQTPPHAWKGRIPCPNIGDLVGVRFSDNKPLPARVLGFVDYSGIAGVQIKCLELPKNLDGFPFFAPRGDEIIHNGYEELKKFFHSKNAFCLRLPSQELDPAPDRPSTKTGYRLEAEHEWAALMAAAMNSRNNWRQRLSTCWEYASYLSEYYDFLGRELQQIRNSGHMKFVEASYKKNIRYVEAVRNKLQGFRTLKPWQKEFLKRIEKTTTTTAEIRASKV
jgi:hypothetical protein